MKERIRVGPSMLAWASSSAARESWVGLQRFRREACWPVNGARHLVIDRMKWQS
jgi:hypothetical protein